MSTQSSNLIHQGRVTIPSVQAPFIDPITGTISTVWWQFFVAIFNGFYASISNNITAVGGAQATAFQLGADWSFVTNVPAGSGVALQVPIEGIETHVFNLGANPLRVYPAAGCQIDNLGVNAPYVLPPGKDQHFHGRTTTNYASEQLG